MASFQVQTCLPLRHRKALGCLSLAENDNEFNHRPRSIERARLDGVISEGGYFITSSQKRSHHRGHGRRGQKEIVPHTLRSRNAGVENETERISVATSVFTYSLEFRYALENRTFFRMRIESRSHVLLSAVLSREGMVVYAGCDQSSIVAIGRSLSSQRRMTCSCGPA